MDDLKSTVGDENSSASNVKSFTIDRNEEKSMEQDSASGSAKEKKEDKSKSQKSTTKQGKKNAVKSQGNIFKRLSIASITKGSRPPKTKKVKEKTATNDVPTREEDDDEEKLVIDIPVDDRFPESSQKEGKVKRLKKHTPKSSSAKKASSESISPSSVDTSKPSTMIPTALIKSENGIVVPESKVQPFLYGWRREVVMRATVDYESKKKAQADIYYFNPRGKKLRSMPEIITHLRETADPILTPENFTFLREPIYTPPMETVRQAKQRSGKNSSSPDMSFSENLSIHKTPSIPKTVKKKKSPQVVSSLATMPITTEVEVSLTEGNENSTPVIEGRAPLGKRGRKIKSLPPDFMSPDDVSKKKLNSTIKPVSIPFKPSPLKHTETNSDAAPTKSSEKLVKKAVKRKLKPNTNHDVSSSPPAKKMTILSPHQIKKEVLSASDSEKSPVPRPSTPENSVVLGNLSPLKDDVLDGGKTRPKVCFTFGKLNKITTTENNNNLALANNNAESKKSQVIPFKKRRVTNTEPIKVSQNDRMCSLTCPGRQCQLPTLHCHICLCLFHPECVGFLNGLPNEEFKCQRCLYQPYLKASEPKPKIISKNTDVNSCDPEALEEEEREKLIASSDDDENFITAPPDAVMDPSQLAKDPNGNLTVEDITARPLDTADAIPGTDDFSSKDVHTKENGQPSKDLGEELAIASPENKADAPEVNPEDSKLSDSTTQAPSSEVVTLPTTTTTTLSSETAISISSSINSSPLDSLVSMVSSSTSDSKSLTSQENVSTINSNGIPLLMPLMNPQTPLPGQIGSLQMPSSMGSLQQQQQMLRPNMSLPSTSNAGISLQIPRPNLLGNNLNPFGHPVDNVLTANSQKPTFPVNLLPNAAPIVVGTQVLTPVSINLTGIAKGTLIYTNNPTLRFLLPSTTGLASFGVQPSVSSLGSGCTSSCMQNPSSEPLQNSSAILSQFLPVTPPVQVINVKEHSLCDLMLKIPNNDGHLFSPKVIFKNSLSNATEDNDVNKDEPPAESVMEDSSGAILSKLEELTKPVVESTKESKSVESMDIDSVVSITALNEPSTSSVDVEKIATNELKDKTNIEETIESKEESENNEKAVTEEKLNNVNSEIPNANDNDSKELFLDEFSDIVGPVLSPTHPVFENDELYNPVDIESLNWWLSESENEDGKRDEEPEPEHRPSTPIVLSQVEYDGCSRVITTRLMNRGAKVSAKSDSCARLSKYKRPVQEFMRDEEHSYNLCDQDHIFKKKKVVTLNLPRKPFNLIQSSYESLNLIFEYLNIPELLNASLVCRTWRRIACQSHLWSTVKLKGVKIMDWKACASALEQRNTSLLDMRGIIQRPDQWHDFLASLYRLRKVQGVVFGEVPSWVISSVVNGLPDLLCLEAEEIVNEKRELVSMDPGVLAQLQQMNILRIRAPDGMQVPDFKLYGGLSSLGLLPNLTHLSLTSLKKLDNDDVVFLEHLPHLQVLEIGQCRTWTELAYHRLGKLRSLRRLRLEMGGAFADRGLANALIQMSRLQELTLLAYRITSSMAASIRRLRHLWHLTIWPDMSSEGAMVVYNTLQAVRNLKRLQSFSWGIIYQDDDSTRYSRKHGKGKYREASEVDEWWSEELRNTPRAKGIKIPMLKAFSDTMPTSGNKNAKSVAEDVRITPNPVSPGGTAIPGMEQGLIGVGHLRQKLQKLLPESEIYVYQVPESLLSRVYGGSCNVISARGKTTSNVSVTSVPIENSLPTS